MVTHGNKIRAAKLLCSHYEAKTKIRSVANTKQDTQKVVADLEQEKDLAGARIGIKLCSCQRQSAKGIEGQRWVLIEAAYIF